MARPHQFWSWSPTQYRWVPASPLGARERFIRDGCEAAYGRHHPSRPGVPEDYYAVLFRADMWNRFADAITAAHTRPHRILPV